MTLAEAGEIFGYWEENPPAHLMLQTIAQMLGWAPRPAPAPPVEDIAAAAPPGLTVTRGGDLGMPAPVDLDALRAKNRAQAFAIARRNQSARVG
ncbi:MAG: hypothetical protein WA459_03495 [Stellaceae bacterium]